MRTPQNGDEVAVLETNHGRIVVGFLPDKAPKHVDSFKSLVGKGFYDGTIFHRVIPGFMIQGGDPTGTGTGGPGYKVPAEFNDTKHERGILSAARSSDPNSAGSQFFLMHQNSPHLDGQYSAFGYVIEGMEVVDAIANTPTSRGDRPISEAKIESATLTTYPLQGEAGVDVK